MSYNTNSVGQIQFNQTVGIPQNYAGNSFGALRYNLNSMLGWIFGAPSNVNVYTYSDLFYGDPTNTDSGMIYYDIANPSTVVFTAYDTTYSDQTLVKIISAIMSGGDDVLSAASLTPIAYSAKYGASDGLFNMSWLPWNVMGLSDGTNYNVKTYYDGGVLNVNPLRREVLWIKLFTFLKISGLTLGSYALVKYGLKKYKKD
jgi:hypothetical protein